jgi:hypothetical protein
MSATGDVMRQVPASVPDFALNGRIRRCAVSSPAGAVGGLSGQHVKTLAECRVSGLTGLGVYLMACRPHSAGFVGILN